MKKRWSLGIAVLLSFTISESMVLAEETTQRVPSDAFVEIEKNTGENGEDPVHPLKPNKPVRPAPGENGEENPHAPSTKGPLSLNYISNLQFGSNQASGNDVIYQVRPDRVLDEDDQVIEVPNFVQVTDHRGTNAGWTLFVKQNGPFMNGTNTLQGTELTFQHPYAVGKSGDEASAPAMNSQFTLTPEGETVRVMVAEENQGMGTWVERFGNSVEEAPGSITLKVPGNTKKVAGRYQTSLTWILSDVPSGE